MVYLLANEISPSAGLFLFVSQRNDCTSAIASLDEHKATACWPTRATIALPFSLTSTALVHSSLLALKPRPAMHA